MDKSLVSDEPSSPVRKQVVRKATHRFKVELKDAFGANFTSHNGGPDLLNSMHFIDEHHLLYPVGKPAFK